MKRRHVFLPRLDLKAARTAVMRLFEAWLLIRYIEEQELGWSLPTSRWNEPSRLVPSRPGCSAAGLARSGRKPASRRQIRKILQLLLPQHTRFNCLLKLASSDVKLLGADSSDGSLAAHPICRCLADIPIDLAAVVALGDPTGRCRTLYRQYKWAPVDCRHIYAHSYVHGDKEYLRVRF